jgi:hypothetical protein
VPDLHAKLFSPSGAEGWFACSGRPVMEAAFPDRSSDASDSGTARHAVVAETLRGGSFPAVDDYVGYYVRLADGKIFMPTIDDGIDVTDGCVEYREEWVEEDQDYVDTVRNLAEGGDLLVEQRVDFRRFLDVKDEGDGFGTADAIVLKPLGDGTYELIVVDRKTGYHEVPAERNKQLMLYALGAYDEHSLVYDISRVRLIIHQRAAREWDCSVDELLAFAQEARSRAISVVNAVAMHGKVPAAEWYDTFLNQSPSEQACKYCRAMATCPSMQRQVEQTVGDSFERMAVTTTTAAEAVEVLADRTPDKLPQIMAAASLLEDFVKAVRAEVERRLLAGAQVPGFKLVLGRAGPRKWADQAAAEATLKQMRLKVEEMYDFTVISPTAAEKLAKAGTIGPRQWPKLQPLISRSDPKPSVAPESDKRDAYTPTPPSADDFDAVASEATDLA